MEKKLLTLVLIEKEGKLLLGMKKRGFGAGRWNGFGGKVLDGETIEAGAKRETEEEAGVVSSDLKEVAVIDFEFAGKTEILEVHVFRAQIYSGTPRETEEMRPKWFSFEQIPYKNMWSDDKYWLPLFLEGKKFKGYFLFDQNDQVLSHIIEVVE